MKLTTVEILNKDQQCIYRTYSTLGYVQAPSGVLKLGETYTLVEKSQIKIPRKLKKKTKKDVLSNMQDTDSKRYKSMKKKC